MVKIPVYLPSAFYSFDIIYFMLPTSCIEINYVLCFLSSETERLVDNTRICEAESTLEPWVSSETLVVIISV